MRVPLLLAVLLLLAGCASPSHQSTSTTTSGAAVDSRVLLSNTTPTTTLAGLTFKASPAVGTGFLGEPTLLADARGRLTLTFPGCEKTHDSCNNAPIFRSSDGGATWKSLNTLKNGSLDPGSPNANGDAMVAIDSAGNLYASNLGAGLPTWRSTDDGATWHYRGNPVPKTESSDRQWSWAGPDGTVVTAWMATSPQRAAAVAVSHDGGANWSVPTEMDASIGWIGPITASSDGQHLWIPYTKPLNTDGDPSGELLLADPQVELRFLHSSDGGQHWEVGKTGHLITKDPAAAQWPGTLMAPVMGRTGSGMLVYAWSEQRLDAMARASSIEATVYAMTSMDGGKTWSAPMDLSGARTAIMPWVVAGSGNRFAVAMYASSDVHLDHDYEGTWDVDLAEVDGANHVVSGVAKAVHTGGICAKGGVCGLSAADRSMLDFLGGALLPDGQLAVAYCSSPGLPGPSTTGLTGGTSTSVFVAVQQTGPPLLSP